MLKQDEFGHEFYESLPAGYRVAELSDFMKSDGKRKLGMEFLLLGFYWPVYQIYHVSATITREEITSFIEEGRCFVKID